MKRNLLLTAVVLAAWCLGAVTRMDAAEPIKTITVEQAMELDQVGDGRMTITLLFDGGQFQTWLSRYGQNQNLLKRDMNLNITQYETSDWNIEIRQMERKVIITFKLQGGVVSVGNGHFQFLVPKAWKGGERHDNVYGYNYVEAAGGGTVMQGQVKLTMPEGASEFSEDQAETGDRIIRYTLAGSAKRSALLWVGVLSLLCGAGLIGYARMGRQA